MKTILVCIYSLAAAFFGMAAVWQLAQGDFILFALDGLLCYYSISHFEDAWMDWKED